jgi:hypothetical protein
MREANLRKRDRPERKRDRPEGKRDYAWGRLAGLRKIGGPQEDWQV